MRWRGAPWWSTLEAARDRRSCRSWTGSCDEILDFFGEGNWFWVACCVQGVAYAAIMEKLKLTWCSGRIRNDHFLREESKKTFQVVTAITIIYLCICFTQWVLQPDNTSGMNPPGPLGLVQYVFACYFVFIFTRTRMAFRTKYRIPGNCFGDCVVSYMCSCCSVLQMYRHLRRSGDRPGRFNKTVEVEIV